MISDNLIAKSFGFCTILLQASTPALDFGVLEVAKNITAIGFLAVALKYAVGEIKRMREAHDKERGEWRDQKEKEIRLLMEGHKQEIERIHKTYEIVIKIHDAPHNTH